MSWIRQSLTDPQKCPLTVTEYQHRWGEDAGRGVNQLILHIDFLKVSIVP